ncbi:BatD family protein [Persicirhabdus sediminis]|uniref:BatD family protein n=1 Tax=Persicirhabdus sediminis TaxID=454144 RepID=A0A8J7SLC4_9BACT|nr:BatD family protein [Persicirhabdus sediminis]MBK1792281.1 BatD family protein [Persicirhabdus sediminis]
MSVRLWFSSGLVCLLASVASADEVAKLELKKSEVWVGEGLPFAVTLYSPGSFVGVANIQIADLPKSVVVKMGSPVVSSETRDGVEYFVQHHDYELFTQQSGQLELPAVKVSFEAKQGYTGDAKKLTGQTDPAKFVSNRPDGANAGEFVLVSENLSISQTWSADGSDVIELNSGELIERRIERKSAGVPAMMMPPVEPAEMAGVRIYQSPAEVGDKVDRGELSGSRVDVVKYQFSHGGSYELPELNFRWWDPSSNSWQSKSLAGVTVKVTGQSLAESELAGMVEVSGLWKYWPAAVLLLVAAGGGFFFRRELQKTYHDWQNARRDLEDEAARALILACRNDQADEAYQVWLDWVKFSPSWRDDSQLEMAHDELCECLYGGKSTSWNGSQLAEALEHFRNQPEKNRRAQQQDLQALNP